MPQKIYKVTIVWNNKADGTKLCLYRDIDEVELPQPIDVRFTNDVKYDANWEEHINWFWDVEKAEAWLASIPARNNKYVYNKPPIDPVALKRRIKKADAELQRIKKVF